MFYEKSIMAIENLIKEKRSDIIAKECTLVSKRPTPLEHLLYMCDQIKTFDTTRYDHAAKAGRWIGWIFAHVELHGLMENETTRILAKEDVINGRDLIH
jgi:hypothetical protein